MEKFNKEFDEIYKKFVEEVGECLAWAEDTEEAYENLSDLSCKCAFEFLKVIGDETADTYSKVFSKYFQKLERKMVEILFEDSVKQK